MYSRSRVEEVQEAELEEIEYPLDMIHTAEVPVSAAENPGIIVEYIKMDGLLGITSAMGQEANTQNIPQ